MKTFQELEAMSGDELNEELSRMLGWTYHDIEYAHIGGGAVFEQFWLPPGIDIKTLTAGDIGSGPNHGRSMPDFVVNLNACHEVEEKLTPKQWPKYVSILCGVTRDRHCEGLVFATARQRTIALILTLQQP